MEPEESAFFELDLPEPLMRAVAASGYRDLTELQEKVIPPVREGQSVIASAGEYSGRTVAFLVPLLVRLMEEECPSVLVVAPTRNLASQVHNEIRRLSFYMQRDCALLDAGARISRQADALAKNPAFAVGTPGRILDHIRRGNADFRELDCLVLLEVNRMLDQMQRSDVEDIVAKVDSVDQVIQLSTVISSPVLRFCRQNVGEAVELLDLPEESSLEGVSHHAAGVDRPGRTRALRALLEEERPERAVVFCDNKDTVERVASSIRSVPGRADSLHAGIPERRAKQIIARFRDGEFTVLVMSEVSSHDLGVDDIPLVVHLEPPVDPEDYAFRLNRIVRPAEGARSIVFRTGEEADNIADIEESLGISMEEYEVPDYELPPERGRRSGARRRGRPLRGRRDSDDRGPRERRRPGREERHRRPEREPEESDDGFHTGFSRGLEREDGKVRHDELREESTHGAIPEPPPEPEAGAEPESADEESSRSSFLAGLDIDDVDEASKSADETSVADEESKSADDKPDTKKENESNEGLFHGGWFKKLRRRR